MIIAVLGLEGSIHINRVLEWMVERGHNVHMIGRRSWLNNGGMTKVGEVTYHYVEHIRDNRTRIKRLLTGSINSHKLPFFQINKIFGLKQLLRKIDADILYSYTLFNRYPGYLGLFSNFTPYVIMPLNGDLLWEPKNKIQEVSTYRQKYFINRAIKKCNHLTASSLAMKDVWLKHGALEERITVIVDPGVDTGRFHPRKGVNEELMVELGVDNCPVVLSPRSMVGYSNIDIIVKSIPRILERVANAKFVFIWAACDEGILKYVKELIDQYDISHAIRLVGNISDYNKLPLYYNVADVSVSLSSCDSTPDTLLEAMASGVPPVCAKLTPIKEWVKNGENGFIVHQQDPVATASRIIELLEKPNLREKFARRNLSIVKKRAGFENQMRKLENIFVKLVKSKL